MFDKGLHKGLMRLLEEGTFSMQIKEVPALVKIYNWAKDLDKLFEENKKKKGKK